MRTKVYLPYSLFESILSFFLLTQIIGCAAYKPVVSSKDSTSQNGGGSSDPRGPGVNPGGGGVGDGNGGGGTGTLPPSAGIAPKIHFVDLESGAATGGPGNLGAPISIFGSGFGTKGPTSKVLIGGQEVSNYLLWAPAGSTTGALNPHLDLIVVQPPKAVAQGSIQVVVGEAVSQAGPTFRVSNSKILYVAKTGNDANSCSEAQPCATLAAGFKKLSAGDLLLVRGGDYTDGEVWIRGETGMSGQAGGQKTLKAYPGEKVSLSNSSRPIIIDADYVTVAGFQFLNGKSTGISERETLAAAHKGNRVINNSFVGNISWAAVDSHGDNHVLAGNNCQVSGSSVGTMGHCYYISHGDGIQILYNIAAGAPGYGIHIYDEKRQSSDFLRVMSNILVEGNMSFSSTQRSGLILACSDDAGLGNRIENVTIRNNVFFKNTQMGIVIPSYGLVKNIKIYNNTFFENGQKAIGLGGTSKNQSIRMINNLFYQSGSTAHVTLDQAGVAIELQNNFYAGKSPSLQGLADSSSKSGTVQFQNSGTRDFRVLAGSQSIDRGVTLPEVLTDFLGQPKNLGAASDMGAYEFVP